MDPLSDVLSLMQVTGLLTARMQAKGTWAMRFPPHKHIKFGTVLEGHFWLWTENTAPLLLEKGDFYLLTSCCAYFCGSTPETMVSDGVEIFANNREIDGVVRYGDGDEICDAVGGKFVFDEAAGSLLLNHLPPLLITRRSDRDSPALNALITMISQETKMAHPGYDIAASSMATLALVHMLREWLLANKKETSWLNALSDKKIGRAISLMHSSPAINWTLPKLATESAMSRSAFSTRFRQLTGLTPGSYLTSWRMELACAELRKRYKSITEIAASVGYQSVPSFTLAFKRYTGATPGAYRSQY